MKKLLSLKRACLAIFCAFCGFAEAQTTILWQMGDEDYSNPELICSDPQNRLSLELIDKGNAINWVGTKSWDVDGWRGVTFTEINDRAGGKENYVDFHLRLSESGLYFRPTDVYVYMEYSGDSDDSEPVNVEFIWWSFDYTEENHLIYGNDSELSPNKAPDDNGINAKTYSIYHIETGGKLPATPGGGIFSIEIDKLDENCNVGFANVILLGNILDEENNKLDEYQYTITPNANDTTISRLSEITVVANNSAIEMNEYELSSIVVKDANGKELAHVVSYEPLKYRNDLCYGYKFTLNKDVVAAGTHTFTIPAGVFGIGYTEHVNEVWTANITVDGSEEDVEVYFEPESGAAVDSLAQVIISSDSISLNDDYDYDGEDGIKVVDKDDNTVDVTVSVAAADDDSGSMVLTIEPAITAAGDYTVKIPAGYFILGESQLHENDALEYTCTVDYSFTTSPDGTGTNLSAITVNANGEISINDSKLSEVVVKKDGGEQVTHAVSSKAIKDENEKTTGYTLTLADNIIVAGTYTYTIPAGLFNCGSTGKTNHELTGSASVDGTLDDYSTLEVTLTDPESAPTQLEQLDTNFSLTVSTNETYKNQEFTLVLSIDNVTTGENIVTADMTSSGDTDSGYTYSWTNSAAETLASGSTYVFSVEVKVNGEDGESEVVGVFDLFTVAGAGSGWSDTKVKSISPDESELTLTDNVFTLTFDTDSALAVKVFADSSYVEVGETNFDFESIESTGEYSDVWTLTVADSVMAKAAKNNGMDLVIVAKDKKGFPVGSDEAQTITYSYTVAKPTVSFDAETDSVEMIYKVTVSSEHISVNENCDAGITVVDGDGNAVNVAVEVKEEAVENTTSMLILFEPVITSAGEYTITIPESFFLLGKSQAYESDSIKLTRTIAYTFSTSTTGEGTSLSEIQVLSNGAISVNNAKLSGIVVKNESGEIVTAAASYEPVKYVNGNIVEYKFDLNDTIVAKGIYNFSIPAGTINLGAGATNEAISDGSIEIDGTKDDRAVYSIMPADGATVSSLGEFTVVTDGEIAISEDYDATSLYVHQAGDTLRATVHVEAAEPIYADDNTVIGYTFTLASEITAAGTYTLTIPEGFFQTADAVLSRRKSVTFSVE